MMQHSTENDILIEMQHLDSARSKYPLSISNPRNKSWCIYKVEKNLKKVHEEFTFHPKLVSIGPYHNKSGHLKPMEDHKLRFFSDFLKSMKLISTASTSDAATTDDDTIIMTKKKQCLVIAAMKELEAKAMDCYSETFVALDSKEFVHMMVLDGCFIIQLLLLFQIKKEPMVGALTMQDDPMFTWRSTLPNLRHDLLLLENQLPFFVLHELFQMSGIDKEKYKLTDLIVDFFNPVLYRNNNVLDVCKTQLGLSCDCRDYCHLLHFLMSSFKTTKTVVQEENRVHPKHLGINSSCFSKPIIRLGASSPDHGHHAQLNRWSIHCVTELREAGIEFKKSDDDHDLLHIEFKQGKLHIPTLFIDDNTVPVLLNFIAYEQCHHSIKPHFTNYLMFLDYLVNSSKDVEHLYYKGIINHGLGSDEEVATLFNKLCKEVVLDLGDNNYLSKVFAEVNNYFGKRRNRWRAAWKHEYFRTPWAFSSFIAAVVLILLTFLQTYFTMYAYFRPPSNS